MPTPHAVISGASIAGLSAAWWLQQIGWRVTLLERAEAFREGGQNVDVRGVAHQVLDRMGLTEQVRALNTTETGTVLLDNSGEIAELPSDGPDGATADLEVLRGDLAKALVDRLPDAVDIHYGDIIAGVEKDDGQVSVTTEAGRTLTADLLVIAEGVRSSTRDLLFSDQVDARDLQITMAFGTIARTPADDHRWRWYNAVGGRQAHLRPDNHGTTRAILAYARGDRLIDIPQNQVLHRLRDIYAGAGWESERILDGFDTSDDVYLDRLTQIRMPTWHRGPVCLVGDAAWCVTPLGGGGASLALTAGYVLAAYLSTKGSANLDAALNAFEQWMRPVVAGVQKLPPGTLPTAYPRTPMGLRMRRVMMKVMTTPPFSALTAN